MIKQFLHLMNVCLKHGVSRVKFDNAGSMSGKCDKCKGMISFNMENDKSIFDVDGKRVSWDSGKPDIPDAIICKD